MGEAAAKGAQARRQIAPGTRIGRYRVLERIAAGGMAEVYLARADAESSLARPVALKLVLPHLAEQPKFVELFEHEARVALAVGHPNIANVLELDRHGADLFMVMEFVDGHTLLDVLAASQGPLPLPCALSVLSQTCAAIHHAHEARRADGTALELVHRDISPSNAMIRHDGVIKVVDFGIAKALSETGLTKTGSLKGKAGYMSPEQCRGQTLDRRSDVFNLGILLYETTTGCRAFGGANMFAVMNKIVDGRFPRPSTIVEDYPPQLEAIVLRAMSLDRSARYPTARALREDIEAFARSEGHALGEATVAEVLARLMGEPEPLESKLDAIVLATTTDPGEVAKRASLPAWLKTMAVGVVTGTVVFALLRTASDDTAPPPSDSAKASEARDLSEAREAPETRESSVTREAPETPPEPAPAAVQPVSGQPDTDQDRPQTAPPSTQGKTDGKAPKRKRKRAKRRKKPTGKPDDPLFTWKEGSK